MKSFSKYISLLLVVLFVLLVGCNDADKPSTENNNVSSFVEAVVSSDVDTSSDTDVSNDAEVSSDTDVSSGTNVSSTTTSSSTHKHTYTKKVSKPTCTAMGYTIYTCSCGYSYRGNEKMALECDYAEWVTVTPATTMQQGLRQRKCKRCGNEEEEILVKKLVRSNVDPAVTIRQTWYRYQFELGSISLDDRRTWGRNPNYHGG